MSQLWAVVWGKSEVDPSALAQAIERELQESPTLDFRTRLLIRDSTRALEKYWGSERLQDWLDQSPFGTKIAAIQKEDLGEPGFPMLSTNLMDRTEPEIVKQYLRELGSQLNQPVTLHVGGSIALILSGVLTRATADIDVVDEVPAVVREKRDLLEDLQRRYHLLLTHFQSHYLPSGWEDRLHFAGTFGSLQIYTVDIYDVFLGKLFSKRSKDLDDLRSIKPHIDQKRMASHLRSHAQAFFADAALRENANHNWYVVFGETLPE